MTRVDELTLTLAEGSISADERRELERLVSESPEAAEAHAALLDLVAALRAGSPPPDVAAATLNQIHERISERIQIGVLSKIRARTPARRATLRSAPTSSRPAVWLLAIAGAALIAVAVALLVKPEPPAPEVRVTPPRVAPPPAPQVPAPIPNPEPPRPIPAPVAPEPGKPPPKPVPEKAPDLPTPVVPDRKPDPKPDPAPMPEPARPETPAATTVVAALLEKAENVQILSRGEKKAARAGQDLVQGDGLEIDGSAVVKFTDGTRLELKARTRIRDLSGGDAKKGKSFELVQGLLAAQVAEQPADRPLTIQTPQAEVRVLGTAFRLSVDPEAEGATHLEVSEGKVRLKRTADGKTVDVARGASARVTKASGPLSAQAQTGLLAHWKLDETTGTTAVDSSGNLLHATLKGDTAWGPGRLGGGLRCAPGGHLVATGLVLPDSFTVAFWVYQPALNKDQDWFMNIGGNLMLMREGNMDPRQIRTGFENPQEFLTVPSVLQPRQWVHLAITFDGAEARLYANGTSAGARKMARRDLRGDATFGRVSAGSEGFFDDIRIYDRALPAADLQRIMAGAPAMPAPRK